MKITRSLVISLCLMVLISALYRIMPNRPWGFAPQIAMALFSGALFVNDKKWAFALPLISLFISDCLYQVLYTYGLTPIQGFYDGQWIMYVLFGSMTVFGFLINKNKVGNVLLASLAAPTTYFLLSNFVVWASPKQGFGLNRPQTFEGLVLTYGDALPFFKFSVIATVVFSAVLFGTYYLVQQVNARKELA
ncbi:hypothetical protein GWC95_08290 [Sediminibacterium roseum]|uniref:Membrane protein YhhN n=1 Tax=Sediminibacterium roseum TaxID=1978412 RepID=A0ABW9ZW24_9BACT|nr:DUF6580 family putative transport protein [Sediminibacterium roseum]NCI49917.1 hypothetical protein [Sediminibacterium roseum]